MNKKEGLLKLIIYGFGNISLLCICIEILTRYFRNKLHLWTTINNQQKEFLICQRFKNLCIFMT